MPFCTFCGQEISDQALSCPNCGHPNESRTTIPEVAFRPSDPLEVRELAGFWIRFGSLVIDIVIVTLVTTPLGSVRIVTGQTVFILNPFRFVGSFAYAWLMIALARGQTLGMMLLGLRTTRPSGEPVSLGRSAARAAMAYLSAIPFFLGYLWALWTEEHRTWHDTVADTRVYLTRR